LGIDIIGATSFQYRTIGLEIVLHANRHAHSRWNVVAMSMGPVGTTTTIMRRFYSRTLKHLMNTSGSNFGETHDKNGIREWWLPYSYPSGTGPGRWNVILFH
jgi:hypothetical protein